MSRQADLVAYETRYRLVFAAGALYWNDPAPNLFLTDLLQSLPAHRECVEFGCGEGYQCYHMALAGHHVLGIDLSPTAIKKAIKNTPPSLDAKFIVGDITEPWSLRMPSSHFDLAVDINCLHMMADPGDRKAYLCMVWDVLKEDGMFYLQDGLTIDDVEPQSDEERATLKELRAAQSLPAGHLLSRPIISSQGKRMIDLPLCPKGMTKSLEGYIDELRASGFKELRAERRGGIKAPYEAVVVSRKDHA